ncbi:MAG: acyl carrier protein [Clostridiales bacterium]|jgi:acyl carrier protein|nr:acyl carrier protein [Clostridiales bacterium]MDD3418599.1 acyl carrier protein [Eubacteriales bacterium]MDY0119862.1 acyl carrier protein [Clostridia bacterium]NLG30207.1 acyl carrier protein [Clostridiaceae bacterium]MCK9349656.1 acyl carrier protein [Clostridiales bacterium]
MTKQEILERIQKILADQLSIEPETIEMTSNIIEDLNADSLDIVELVMSLEAEFDMAIMDEEAERIRTVGDAVDFIHAHL